MPLLEVQHVQKIYTTRFGGNQIQALTNVSFSVEPGSTWPSWGSPAPARPPC